MALEIRSIVTKINSSFLAEEVKDYIRQIFTLYSASMRSCEDYQVQFSQSQNVNACQVITDCLLGCVAPLHLKFFGEHEKIDLFDIFFWFVYFYVSLFVGYLCINVLLFIVYGLIDCTY
jgi:hypothetical protein